MFEVKIIWLVSLSTQGRSLQFLVVGFGNPGNPVELQPRTVWHSDDPSSRLQLPRVEGDVGHEEEGRATIEEGWRVWALGSLVSKGPRD